jgi:hypothetical protein
MLAPGEYYLLVIMDWKSRPYDLTLAYQANYPALIDRPKF